MTNLVLLQRMRPDRVCIARGSAEDLLDRMCLGEPLDSSVEVLAEFPQRGDALELAEQAMGPSQNGWYDMHPGIALQTLGTLFGASKLDEPPKKPNTVWAKLGKDDRELLKAIRDGKTAGKTELCKEDRELLQTVLRMLSVIGEKCGETRILVQNLQEDVGKLKHSLCQNMIHIRRAITANKRSEETEPERSQEFTIEHANELQGDLPRSEHEEVEEWPVEPQCREAAAKPQGEEKTKAGVQRCEMKQQQEEITTVEPQRCQEPAANAEQHVAIEGLYEDLSDLSSVDGNESPHHKQLKCYAAEKRAARKRQIVGTCPAEPANAHGDRALQEGWVAETALQEGLAESALQEGLEAETALQDALATETALRDSFAAETALQEGLATETALQEGLAAEPTEPEPTELVPTHIASVSVELVPCAKQEAESVTCIRQALRAKCGDEVAAAILGQCHQKVLRDSAGKLQRYWVDATGATLKLAHQKNVAP